MRSKASNCLFRTQAWANAWLDVWAKDAGIELIDLGGNKIPGEMVYRTYQRIKKIVPVASLHFVGAGSPALSTPRAEYNDVDGIINSASRNVIFAKLKTIQWSRFYMPDMVCNSASFESFKDHVQREGWAMHTLKRAPAYYVDAKEFEGYLAGLGANTRLAYFNRRERLRNIGEISFQQFSLEEMPDFFKTLNDFHLMRWGQRCYSDKSQLFMRIFIERLKEEGGIAIAESMSVNGEVVSVLFDIVLNGCRYNLQSGYVENKFSKIALGAIHMGYGIQAAIESGLIYDFMAGEGKHSNYKERISTHQEMIQSVVVERGLVKYLRDLKINWNRLGAT
ncbi:MAG: GNAT family N-acetyltransferase [Chitinophagaceae bacterium]|nr:MAG: GNAT family N-acetyltransferase [Chitinophagaceae bacterium]